MEDYICPTCKTVFRKYRDKRSKVRTCSRICYLSWLASSDNPASKAWFKKDHKTNVGRIPSLESRVKISLGHNREKSNPSGSKSPHWKGGICVDKAGYILVRCLNHPYASKGYVRQHRLVMEKIIGRYLLPGEEVHHINGKKQDNRPENIKLFANAREHADFHYRSGFHCLPPGGKKRSA